MAETERDPRCGEGTGGLFAPEEGIWEEWKGYGELRFGVRPGHPRKAVTSISQAEALAHGLTHLHHLVFAAVLARELDWCAALQDAREDARHGASSASDFVAMFGSRFVVTTIGLRFL